MKSKTIILAAIAALASALLLYGALSEAPKVVDSDSVTQAVISTPRVGAQTEMTAKRVRSVDQPTLSIPETIDEDVATPPNHDIFTEEHRLEQLARETAELETKLGEEGDSEQGDQARELVNSILAEMDDSRRMKISLDRFECYSNGCVAGLQYSDSSTFMGSSELFTTGTLSMTWKGPRAQTGPKPAEDGSVESNWYLFF